MYLVAGIDKIFKQMGKRGWTGESIENTIQRPYPTSAATNKATGGDATAYFNKAGSYIVKDNASNDIVQLSDRNDPNWVPDVTVKTPYIQNKNDLE